MGMLDDDLEAMLSDPGLEPVTVACGAESTSGHFNQGGDILTGGLEAGESAQVLGTHVRIQTGSLPSLVRHAAVTVTDVDGGSTSWKARDIIPTNDGKETLVALVPG